MLQDARIDAMAIQRLLLATYWPVQILVGFRRFSKVCGQQVIFKPATETECDVVEVGLRLSGRLRKKTLRVERRRIGIYSFVERHPSSEIQHKSPPEASNGSMPDVCEY
jgi:hypothetical protein